MYSNRIRQHKKSRRWTLAIGLVAAIVAICGYSIAYFSKDAPRPSVVGAQSVQPTLKTTDMQLAWPTTGQAAIANVEDQQIARSSDAEKPRPTASMAKIITALAIMKKQPFTLGQSGQTFTITSEDISSLRTYIAEEGSVLPLLIGTKMTQYQAMQRMLIASDNNMADILAKRVFGSKEAYVSYAQNMLKDMGLKQTVVADASGYSSDTISTPSELVTLGIAALKNPVIAEIVAQQQTEVPPSLTIKNTNELLGDEGIIGIKTGTTNEAGSCLLFAARYADRSGQNKTIVGVIMGDTSHASLYSDSRELLASARQGFGLVKTANE